MKDKGCVILSVVVIAALCGAGYSLYRMLDFNLVGETEVSRTTSPDGALDAVTISRDPGATGSTAYLVGVTERGSSLDDRHIAYVIDNVDHPERLKVTWRKDALEITVPPARNFKQEKKILVGNREIALTYKAFDSR